MAIFWQNDFTAPELPWLCEEYFSPPPTPFFFFFFKSSLFLPPSLALSPWLTALVHFCLFNWAPDEFTRQGHSSCGSGWRTSPGGAGLTAPAALDAAWLWKFTYLGISAAISLTSFVYPCHYHFSFPCNHLKCRLLLDKWDRARVHRREKKVTWIACYELGWFFFSPPSPLLIPSNVNALINLIFTLFLL